MQGKGSATERRGVIVRSCRVRVTIVRLRMKGGREGGREGRAADVPSSDSLSVMGVER